MQASDEQWQVWANKWEIDHIFLVELKTKANGPDAVEHASIESLKGTFKELTAIMLFNKFRKIENLFELSITPQSSMLNLFN